MIINLANAIRLQDRNEDANRLLDTQDWSATSDDFKICVASVRGDLDKVLKIMDDLGTRFNPDHYRTWPVFRRTRSDSRLWRNSKRYSVNRLYC